MPAIFLETCKTLASARDLQGSSRAQSAAQPEEWTADPCTPWQLLRADVGHPLKLAGGSRREEPLMLAISCLYQASFWKPWGLVWARRSKGGKPWKFAAKHFSQASPQKLRKIPAIFRGSSVTGRLV